jgi:UDP-GlcNAc:undecaprenyl-phosphate GlcNAc-1-phosphate transferase
MIYAIAFFLVLLSIPLVCRLAARFGFVDTPQGRKQHEQPVPPLGGAVIFIVFLAMIIMVGQLNWAVLLALALVLVVGIIDDAWEVNSIFKFAIHFLAAFILVLGGGAQIETLGNLLGFGEMTLGWFAIPFSVACVVYIQNAINMMDGMDGLAGGITAMIFSFLLWAAYSTGQTQAAVELGIILSCLIGFLVYNMRSPFLKHAKIFLGDAGSMALGLMIAWYAITLSQNQNATTMIQPVSVAWLIALPIVDAFGLLAIRLREGRPPFSPDRRHFHHHFAEANIKPNYATPIIICYAACLGLVGFVGIRAGVPVPVLGWLWVALWMSHTYLTMKPHQFIKLLSRHS